MGGANLGGTDDTATGDAGGGSSPPVGKGVSLFVTFIIRSVWVKLWNCNA